ncbi:MAG: transglutaminase-like domain-containing protein, partial [Pirellulales bacterium]|nr:transglutaminase-like domain-containing protein [Pirellulales bacterium]
GTYNMQAFKLLLVLALLPSIAAAQQQLRPRLSPNGPQLADARTQYIQFGIEITAKGGPVHNLVGTVPVPIDWPEQQIRIVDEEQDDEVRKVTYRKLGDTVKQMRVELPRLGAGKTAKVIVTYEIRRHAMTAPGNTSELKIPKTPGRDLRIYLGPSPYIESTHYKIRALAKEVLKGKEDATDWEKVEAIYDWVRDNIKYSKGTLKSSYQAFKDKTGDCEELTSLFIAMCRANKIPARMVWIPGHCYPEFYLEDADGKGHWFPCQAAGGRAFGSMPEWRPILQKGDNFRDPDRRGQKLRYVSTHLSGKKRAGDGSPSVKFIRKNIAAPRKPIF